MKLGELCIKTAGRDAGNEAIIIDVLDDNFVMIDGNVRRKKCNIKHLESTGKLAKIEKNASTETIKKALVEFGIKISQPAIVKKEKTKKANKK